MYNRENNEEFNNNEETEKEFGEGLYQDRDIGLKIPVPVILFLLAILALSVVGLIRFPGVFKDYKVYKTAEMRIENGDTYETLNDLFEITEKYPSSLPIIMLTTKKCMENGFYDSAAYIINTYIVGKNLYDHNYNLVENYVDKLDQYYHTLDSIDIIFEELSDDQMSDSEYGDIICEKLKGLLDEEDLDQSIVCYYLAMFEEDVEKAVEYLEKCYDLDPNCYDVCVQLGVFCRRAGDYKKARKYTNKALGKDRKDSGALRALAILDMLEGKLEEGLINAQLAYDSYGDGMYVRETYMIALHFNGKTGEADLIMKEINENQGNIDEDTQLLLDGDISLEEYYVEG